MTGFLERGRMGESIPQGDRMPQSWKLIIVPMAVSQRGISVSFSPVCIRISCTNTSPFRSDRPSRFIS